tara:strand:+ start:3215 stop:4036 length:822 start_codon:yes stop_codon:yes gene_type:complete
VADYAIGDVQGCYDELMNLLETIQFNDVVDKLWFVGDLVNRGPQSLAVLRFVRSLSDKAIVTLGNHDLYLLSRIYTDTPFSNADDSIDDILKAPDVFELGEWLRHQKIMHVDKSLDVVMTHAGICPLWRLDEAIIYAKELEKILHQNDFKAFLKKMYGNMPARWEDDLQGYDRLRVICNYMTRMRFCEADGSLNFSYKGSVNNAPESLYPWFETPGRQSINVDLIFGHWAALLTPKPQENIYAIDTGCLWGGHLTALRIQDKRFFSVKGRMRS